MTEGLSAVTSKNSLSGCMDCIEKDQRIERLRVVIKQWQQHNHDHHEGDLCRATELAEAAAQIRRLKAECAALGAALAEKDGGDGET